MRKNVADRSPHAPLDRLGAEWDEDPRPWREPEARARRDSALALVATIIAVVFGAAALIAMRDKIVRIAPFTAAAYSAAGLEVNLAGLDLRGVTSRVTTEGARKVLTVEGEIVNLRRRSNHVPELALAVRGEDGRERYAWTAPAPKSRLEAGESVRFSARLAAPPADGTQVQARFADLEAAAR